MASATLAPNHAHAQDASQDRGIAGPVVGGVVGALLGSKVGGGHGREIATGAGAILGAIVGDGVQNNRPAQAAPVQQVYQNPPVRSYGGESTREVVRYVNADSSSGSGASTREVVRYVDSSVGSSASSNDRGIAGAVIGGGTGALLGSTIGKGNGKLVATGAMGIMGAIVGDAVQNSDYDKRVQAARQPQVIQRQAVVTSYAAPSGMRALSGEERQQMDLIVKSLQQSRATWVMSLSAVESAKATKASKPELEKMQRAEAGKRAAFIAQRDDFTGIVTQMAGANYDVGQYTVISQAYGDVSMSSREKANDQVSVQMVKRSVQAESPVVINKTQPSYQNLSGG